MHDQHLAFVSCNAPGGVFELSSSCDTNMVDVYIGNFVLCLFYGFDSGIFILDFSILESIHGH